MVAYTSNLSTMEAESGGLIKEFQSSQAKGRLSQILPNNK